jgi:hypothetical protein
MVAGYCSGSVGAVVSDDENVVKVPGIVLMQQTVYHMPDYQLLIMRSNDKREPFAGGTFLWFFYFPFFQAE